MNRFAKNISSSLRPLVEQTKAFIRDSAGKWFDADGYVGKTAIKELRAVGWKIEHNKERGSYRTKACQHPPQRLHSWFAKNCGKEIHCVACNDCGAVLLGGAE